MKRKDPAARGKGDNRQHRNKECATPDDPTAARKPQGAAPRTAAPPSDPRETQLKVKGPRPAPHPGPKEPHLRVPPSAPPPDPDETNLVSQSAPPPDPREPHLRPQPAPPADPKEPHLAPPRRHR